MKLKYEQAILRQRALTPMLQDETLTPKQKNWYLLLLETAESMIRNNDPMKQWLIQLKIQALEAEMALYEKAVNEREKAKKQ